MRTRATLASLTALALGATLWVTPAGAHTESDVIAVPAGSQATVTFEPTHGCDGSPTVDVAVRAPVAGAVGGEVEGWTATANPDANGNTVIEWKGGTLAADAKGAFPVTFTAPDAAGTLLLFPAVQTCENGAEESWIGGDPDGDNPAPRILVLPAGSELAHDLDEVAADAPGRDQLTAVVTVPNLGADGTTTTAATTTTAEAGAATATTAAATDDTTTLDMSDDTKTKGDMPWPIVILVVAGVAVVVAAAIGARARRQAAARADEPNRPNDPQA